MGKEIPNSSESPLREYGQDIEIPSPPDGFVRIDAISVDGRHYYLDPPYEGEVGTGLHFSFNDEAGTAKVIPPEGSTSPSRAAENERGGSQ
jgi:hypothetical protein